MIIPIISSKPTQMAKMTYQLFILQLSLYNNNNTAYY